MNAAELINDRSSYLIRPGELKRGVKMIYMCDGGPMGRLRILIKLILSALFFGALVYFAIAAFQ